jgi:polyhydroxyalkanoate synthesis regulator phasin
MAKKKATATHTQKQGNGSADIIDLVRRPFLMSIGAMALAEQQVSDVIDSLRTRGVKARKAGEKYIKKLNERPSDAIEESRRTANKRRPGEHWITRTLRRLNVPTTDDIEKLNKKVDAPMKRIA